MQKAHKYPTVIALKHRDFRDEMSQARLALLKATQDKIIEIITKAPPTRKKRTLFIEGDTATYEKDPGNEPFRWSVITARARGWRIIPLDRTDFRKMLFDQLSSEMWIPKRMGDSSLEKYILYNLREKYWARVLERNNASSNDLVVMHPNHIRGFLIESHIPGRNVQWISRPDRLLSSRLGTKDRRRVLRKRTHQRTIRQKNITRFARVR